MAALPAMCPPHYPIHRPLFHLPYFLYSSIFTVYSSHSQSTDSMTLFCVHISYSPQYPPLYISFSQSTDSIIPPPPPPPTPAPLSPPSLPPFLLVVPHPHLHLLLILNSLLHSSSSYTPISSTSSPSSLLTVPRSG